MSPVAQESLPSDQMGTAEVALETLQVIDLCKHDLDFLAGVCLPEIYKYAFPALYREMWTWMCAEIAKGRSFSQLAIGLPRGFAKTLLIKLFIIYVILFTNRQFILVISENEDKSKSILSDVSDMLDEPNIKAVFGDWRLGMELDQQAKKVFGYRGRNILLKGVGAGTGIRGITEKNRRPDVMIFDDIQSREDADSAAVSQTLERWMYGTAMKAKSPEGCLYFFIANMYPTPHSLLRKLKDNPNWVKFIVGGITLDGKSLWEELQPIEQLIREFQNDLASGHPEIFYAEVLNDENAAVNNLVDLSAIPDYHFSDDDICQGKVIIIDPSNPKVTSDLTSIGYFEFWDGFPALRVLIEGRLSPVDTIRETLKLAIEKGCQIIAIESTAYQYTLNYWFAWVCEQQGIQGIECVELYPGMMAKNSRILAMLKALQKGQIYLHPSVRAAVYLQITQFQPLKRDNNDGILDLLTYATKVLDLYGTQILNSNIIAEQESNAIDVILDNSPF